MMKTIYSLEDVRLNPITEQQKKWRLARPENAKNLWWKIKASIQVLKGRAVPVAWY